MTTTSKRLLTTPGMTTVNCGRKGHGMSFGTSDGFCDKCYTEGGGNSATRILKTYIRDAADHEAHGRTAADRLAARERRELLERVLDATVAEMARMKGTL